MINNISDQVSSFPCTQLNQSNNFLDSLREFFAILNSSRKGELSTWDTIYLHLILAINADSDLIKNDVLLAENIPTADYQFNTFFSNAFETDVKKYLGKSEDNEVEIKRVMKESLLEYVTYRMENLKDKSFFSHWTMRINYNIN